MLQTEAYVTIVKHLEYKESLASNKHSHLFCVGEGEKSFMPLMSDGRYQAGRQDSQGLEEAGREEGEEDAEKERGKQQARAILDFCLILSRYFEEEGIFKNIITA
jgi:hypothetical protein